MKLVRDEDMARDLELIHVDTNWHTTSSTNFYHEKQRDYDLDYHWQQHFWNISKIAYIPIIFQALCGPWILDRSTVLRDNMRQQFSNFPLRLGILRETRVHLPCPREMLRPPVQVASASNPNRYPLVVKPGDRRFSYWSIGFPWPGYAIGGCTFQNSE